MTNPPSIPVPDPIHELKVRAELLHKAALAGDPGALQRLRTLPELRKATPEALATFAGAVRRKHALAVVAREVGFDGWAHASTVLGGALADDVGTLLCLLATPAYWNIWSASYPEAQAIRAEHGGYLLAYKRQFFIADQHYVAAIGLDPDDPDWARIGRDWARPRDPAARTRLYGRLLAAQPRPALAVHPVSARP